MIEELTDQARAEQAAQMLEQLAALIRKHPIVSHSDTVFSIDNELVEGYYGNSLSGRSTFTFTVMLDLNRTLEHTTPQA